MAAVRAHTDEDGFVAQFLQFVDRVSTPRTYARVQPDLDAEALDLLNLLLDHLAR